jgi:GT2 family glycosyltransferase
MGDIVHTRPTGLTVGITTRNRPESLRACLASLSVIAGLEPEVLVFDDASASPAADHAAACPLPVRVVRDDAAPGPIVGRNRLVKEAAGEFVLLLDDDTRILSIESVEAALQVLRGDRRVAAVAFAQAEADGRPWPDRMQPSTARVPAIVTSFIGFAHMVRRAAFLSVSGYREALGFYGEEKELCLRLVHAGHQTVYLPDARVAHVPDPANRDPRQHLRRVARNDCLNSLYNDPVSRLLWMLPARFVLYFRMRRSWQVADPWGGWWLARDLMRRLPAILRDRRPVSRATLARWRAIQQGQTAYEPPHVPVEGVPGR